MSLHIVFLYKINILNQTLFLLWKIMEKSKQQIREEILIKRKKLTNKERNLFSKTICKTLEQTTIFQNAKCIAFYYATPDEVQTIACIEKRYTQKKIVLPIVKGENLAFYEYKGKNQIKKGSFDIMEPIIENTDEQAILPENIDIFIVPGMAFDQHCNRIGHGKGFYDRLLSEMQKPKIGLCFSCQLLDNIPTKKHDIKMSMVITEEKIFLHSKNILL